MDVMDLSTWKVLAVDDEPDSLEVLIEALSMHDASVQGVASGREALEALQSLRPTLVITDLSMPDLDGYQLLYKIRHMDGLRETPVIALTAHAMAGDRERILAAGFDGYVSKPLRIATLATDILAVLSSLASLKPAIAEQPSMSPKSATAEQPNESPKPATAEQSSTSPKPAAAVQLDESLKPTLAPMDEVSHQ
jgi:CheY-like chemotaxis protein